MVAYELQSSNKAYCVLCTEYVGAYVLCTTTCLKFCMYSVDPVSVLCTINIQDLSNVFYAVAEDAQHFQEHFIVLCLLLSLCSMSHCGLTHVAI